jgi:hypothetical protein
MIGGRLIAATALREFSAAHSTSSRERISKPVRNGAAVLAHPLANASVFDERRDAKPADATDVAIAAHSNGQCCR